MSEAAADPASSRGYVPRRAQGVPPDGGVDGGRHAPLLIVCALGIEGYALRRGDPGGHHAADGSIAVLRTGMGRHAAWRAVSGALRGDPALRNASVLATGLCGGLANGIRPGDVVVDDRGTANGVLAAALDGLGVTVHSGRIVSRDRLVRGAQRRALGASGATAVDMESAAVWRAALDAGPRPVTAVRVVVDTPEHELLRVGTLRTGITALRVLSSVLPAFLHWHRLVALPWR